MTSHWLLTGRTVRTRPCHLLCALAYHLIWHCSRFRGMNMQLFLVQIGFCTGGSLLYSVLEAVRGESLFYLLINCMLNVASTTLPQPSIVDVAVQYRCRSQGFIQGWNSSFPFSLDVIVSNFVISEVCAYPRFHSFIQMYCSFPVSTWYSYVVNTDSATALMSLSWENRLAWYLFQNKWMAGISKFCWWLKNVRNETQARPICKDICLT